MRKLAVFCFAFAFGVFLAQYLLPLSALPYLAGAFALLGALALLLPKRGNLRLRAVLCALGLALAFAWDWAYTACVQAPMEALAGTTAERTLTLTDFPTATERGARVEVRVAGFHGKAVYYGDASLLSLAPGQEVTASVSVSSAASIRDEEITTFTSRGVFLLLYGRGEARVSGGDAGALRYLPQRIARRAKEVIGTVFPARTQPLLRAILLGDRSALAEEDLTCLSEAGLLHITAVSGLHCAFLLSLLSFLIGRHRRRLLAFCALPVLALYALVVGGTPSVVRACFMLLMLLLAPLFGRESDPPTSLALALFLILLVNPFAAASISLQLSFGAMAGLLWLTPKLYERVARKKRSAAGRFVLASLAATAGALVFTAPLSAYYFNLLVLIAPLSNLLCLWAASATFMLGFVTVGLGWFFPAAARLLAYLPHAGAWYLLAAARLLTRVPYHAVYFTNRFLRLWLAYAYALLFACVIARRGRFRYPLAEALAAGTLALSLWLGALPLHGGTLHLAALDVGQGQSVALHSGGKTALIDCGSAYSYVSAGEIAADYLQGLGCQRIDYLVLSHYHADHCSGLAALLPRMAVGTLVLPDIEPDDPLRQTVLDLAARYGVPVLFVHETQRLPLGAAELTVFPPLTEGEMNEECLSVLCTTGSFDALFTGDMDANTEYLLIANHRLPDIEVLMLGHHGSQYSTGEDLLAEVKPEVGIVSCGRNNGYGHPHAAVLRRLAERGAAVYRTDRQGTIEITVN